jgi:hypothetical protein
MSQDQNQLLLNLLGGDVGDYLEVITRLRSLLKEAKELEDYRSAVGRARLYRQLAAQDPLVAETRLRLGDFDLVMLVAPAGKSMPGGPPLPTSVSISAT